MLCFRSPKERTPDPYNPRVSFDGKPLQFSTTRTRSVKTSLPRSKRFVQYETDAHRTAFIVGPGSYDTASSAVGRSKVRGGPVYRPYHIGKGVEDHGYFMVGDQLVFDAHYMSTPDRSASDLFCRANQTSVLRTRDNSEQALRPRTAKRTKADRSPICNKLEMSLQQALKEALTPESKLERPKSRVVKSPYLSRVKAAWICSS
jgi:hypothetical protein